MKSITQFAVVLSLLFLVGCIAPDEDGTPSCEISEDVGTNEMTGQVDGENWTAISSGYQIAGAVGFISAFTLDAHNLISIRLHHTAVFTVNEGTGLVEVDDGDDVSDVFEAGGGPYEFFLGSASADGGDVTLTVEDEVFHTGDGDGAGGYLYIEAVTEGQGNNSDVARGCFYFDAGSDGSNEVLSVVDGSFSVTAM
jgi:hypothetical protein